MLSRIRIIRFFYWSNKRNKCDTEYIPTVAKSSWWEEALARNI
jgi:hypothetical protein